MGKAGSSARHEMRLLVERLPDGTPPAAAEAFDEIAVAPGVRALDPAALRLVAARAARDDAGAPRFEAVRFSGRPALLMLAAPSLGVRVNGHPAPRVALLEVGDEVRCADAVMHVTRRREVRVGPPVPELLGRPCGVCRVPLVESTEVLVHDCGAPLHLEPASKPEAERLQCALLGDCPSCGGRVSTEPGLVYRPGGPS